MNIVHTLTDPVVWIVGLVIAILFGVVGASGSKPPMVDDSKRDPLAGLRPMGGGSVQAETEIPEQVRAALMEITAEAIRTNSLHKFWDLNGLQSGGFPLGSYRITIEKTA